MNVQDQSSSQTELNSILEILYEIRQKSRDGDYIYRGEPECYGKVSSTLYRKLEAAQVLHLDVEEVQKAELRAAKDYTDETDDFKILVQLQHFGGKTNLIDFTTDYLIALFFVANGSPSKDGRIIWQDKTGEVRDWIREFQHPYPESRPAAQKSIFVRSPAGFIQPDESIVIPKSLKRPLLDYLEREFDISHRRVYYDLHGFISSRDVHWNIYEELGKGRACHASGEDADDAEEKDKYYQEAVEHYSNAIQLMPEFTLAYNGRGLVYLSKEEFDKAIDDFSKEIELNPRSALAYSGRSAVYRALEEYDKAIDDSKKAIRLNPDDASAYHMLGFAYFFNNDFNNAITSLNEAIHLNPDYATAYLHRGLAYREKGNFEKTIADLDEAIKLDTVNALAYYIRGDAWLHLKEWNKAKEDLIDAVNKGLDISTQFHSVYKSVVDFEQEIGSELPEDIAVMLH